MVNLQLVLFRGRENHFEPHSPMILSTPQPPPHNPPSTQPLPHHNPHSTQPLPHKPSSTQPLQYNPPSTHSLPLKPSSTQPLPHNLPSTHPMPHNLPSTQSLPHNIPSTHPIPHNPPSNQPIPHNSELPCGIFQSGGEVESSPGPPNLVCGPPYTLSVQGRTSNTNESNDIWWLFTSCLKGKEMFIKNILRIIAPSGEFNQILYLQVQGIRVLPNHQVLPVILLIYKVIFISHFQGYLNNPFHVQGLNLKNQFHVPGCESKLSILFSRSESK